MEETKVVTSKSYTLHTESGHWLAQIVLTSDGMFASVTDYGNLSYAWRSYGDKDFRKFMAEISTDYFATKLYTGLAYVVHTRAVEKACDRFSKEILTALQKVLKQDMIDNPEW